MLKEFIIYLYDEAKWKPVCVLNKMQALETMKEYMTAGVEFKVKPIKARTKK